MHIDDYKMIKQMLARLAHSDKATDRTKLEEQIDQLLINHVDPDTSQRRWKFLVNASEDGFLRSNRRYQSRREQDALISRWRRDAYTSALGASLPRGLTRARIDVWFCFAVKRRRDRLNWAPTVKPIIDALCPAPTPYVDRKNNRYVAPPGLGVLVDDDDAHLDGPHIKLWPDASPNKLIEGSVLVVITDLSG